MMGRLRLRYGKGHVEVEVPAKSLTVLEPRDVAPLRDPPSEIRRALDSPIASKRVRDLVRPRTKVTILCDDYTRGTPAHLIIPCLLDELRGAGVRAEEVRVIVALGSHRPATEGEMRDKVGEEVYEECSVMNHSDEEGLVDLGKTSSGTPIRISRHVVDSDLLIGVGMIMPHRVAGFSGGSKIVQPGVSGSDTTGHTHWLSARFPAEELLGREDNPVRGEMDAIAERLKLRFIVNVVLDGLNRVCGVFAGDFREAHRRGARLSRAVYGVEVPQRADVAICDCPHPSSIDMWQAAKSICAADLAVRPGGTIVLLAPCPEGISGRHPEVEAFGYRPYGEVEGLVKRGAVKDLTAAAHMAHVGSVVEAKRVILVSEGIDEDVARRVGFEHAPTPDEAVRMALGRHGPGARVVVMRDSPGLLPIVG